MDLSKQEKIEIAKSYIIKPIEYKPVQLFIDPKYKLLKREVTNQIISL